MAYTERFVTSAAGGGGDGTEGNPWTLAEGLTNATAGDRVNVQSDSGYSLGADTVSGTGTFSQLICFRGYDSAIGDRENNGWNADGTLDVTGFPVITLTGTLSWGGSGDRYILLQNLVLTGSLSAVLVGDGLGDRIFVVECKITNTANSTAAFALRFDNHGKAINCDLECSGAAHNAVVDGDITLACLGCRIKGRAAGQVFCQLNDGLVIGCLIQGEGGNGIGVGYQAAVVSNNLTVYGNTFFDLERDIQFPDFAPSQPPTIANNHATDSGEFINNLHSGTANLAMIEVNNRTRDITTPRTGVGDGANIGEVTTDTGGSETDYTDAASDDFTLVDGAPGVEAGMRQHTDIGAYQRAAALSVEVHNALIVAPFEAVPY